MASRSSRHTAASWTLPAHRQHSTSLSYSSYTTKPSSARDYQTDYPSKYSSSRDSKHESTTGRTKYSSLHSSTDYVPLHESSSSRKTYTSFQSSDDYVPTRESSSSRKTYTSLQSSADDYVPTRESSSSRKTYTSFQSSDEYVPTRESANSRKTYSNRQSTDDYASINENTDSSIRRTYNNLHSSDDYVPSKESTSVKKSYTSRRASDDYAPTMESTSTRKTYSELRASDDYVPQHESTYSSVRKTYSSRHASDDYVPDMESNRRAYSRLHATDSYVPEDKKTRYDYSPQFTVSLRPRLVHEGECARFTASVTGVPNPTVTWYRGPVQLPNTGRFISVNSFGLLSLEITGVSRDDSGLYTCKAVNEHGGASCCASLEIQETEYEDTATSYTKPRFEQPVSPALVNASEGETVTLEAKVTGYPLPEFKWLKDGVGLIESHRVRLSADETGRLSLCITHAQIEDTGLFHCVATNKFGRCETYSSVRVVEDLDRYKSNLTSRDSISSDVTGKDYALVNKMALADGGNSPWFIKQLPDSMSLQEGEPLRLECIVLGDPTPVVTWEKSGRTLKYGARHRVVVDGTRHTLEISDTMLTDHGEYSATAQSAIGTEKSKTTYVDITPRFTQFEETIIHKEETTSSESQEGAAPVFVAELPRKIELAEDDMLRLNCAINGAEVEGEGQSIVVEGQTIQVKKQSQNKEQETTVVMETRTYTSKQGQTFTESKSETQEENGLGAPVFVKSLLGGVVAEVGSSAEFKCSFGDDDETEQTAKKAAETLLAPMFIKSLGTMIAQPGDNITITCTAVDTK